jgi:uncharacterized protein (DUF697 family)
MRTWWALLGVGFILVALSFPVYLLLDSARGLWRTQFLSGIGAGLVLAALSGLISHAFVRHTAKIALFLAFGAVIAFFGTGWTRGLRQALKRHSSSERIDRKQPGVH